MSDQVFVVYQWSDFCSGGNSCDIIGIYRNKETTKQKMENVIKEFNKKLSWDVEQIDENSFNLINGADYEVFEMCESLIV